MKSKGSRILLLIGLLASLVFFVYIGSVALSYGAGGLCVYIGALVIFIPTIIYYLGCVIASFRGHKVIGQIVSSKYSPGDYSSSLSSDLPSTPEGWYSTYVYLDKQNRYWFGSIATDKKPERTVLVRHFGMFHWASEIDGVSKEECDTYDWSNVVMEEAIVKSHNFSIAIWAVRILRFVIAMILFSMGASIM